MNITLSHSVKLNIRGFREMCLRVLYQKIDKMFKMFINVYDKTEKT